MSLLKTCHGQYVPAGQAHGPTQRGTAQKSPHQQQSIEAAASYRMAASHTTRFNCLVLPIVLKKLYTFSVDKVVYNHGFAFSDSFDKSDCDDLNIFYTTSYFLYNQ